MEKYLGFLILHGRLQHKNFEFLLEKINERLVFWQYKLLNKVYRLTLDKNVLNPIPNYYMQVI